MTDAATLPRPAGMGRVGIAAAWASAVCCLPYLFIKVIWAVGVPVGITDTSMLDEPGFMASNAFMAVIELVGVGLVVAIARPWALRLPAWLLLLPAWTGTGMLLPIIVGVGLMGLVAPFTDDTGTDWGGIRPWVYVLVYTGFAGQGIALAVAFACHVRTRWGRLLATRTEDALIRLRPRRRAIVAGSAVVAAALAAVVTGVFGYWAGGGGSAESFDLPWANYVGQACGSSLTVVGMVALVARWGHRKRLWLPVTLGWLGSGALVADALFFTGLNQVLAPSRPAWNLLDTVRTLGAAAGLLAAVVTALIFVAHERRRDTP